MKRHAPALLHFAKNKLKSRGGWGAKGTVKVRQSRPGAVQLCGQGSSLFAALGRVGWGVFEGRGNRQPLK